MISDHKKWLEGHKQEEKKAIWADGREGCCMYGQKSLYGEETCA